jgi:hypothetical protein
MSCFTCGSDTEVRKTYVSDDSRQPTCRKCRKALRVGEYSAKQRYVATVSEWDHHSVDSVFDIVFHKPWCHYIEGAKTVDWEMGMPCKSCLPEFQ